MEQKRNESTRVFALGVLALGIVLWLTAPGAAGAVQVGDRAPDFVLPSTAGGRISLSDLREKGMVLIQFYHADYGPT